MIGADSFWLVLVATVSDRRLAVLGMALGCDDHRAWPARLLGGPEVRSPMVVRSAVPNARCNGRRLAPWSKVLRA